MRLSCRVDDRQRVVWKIHLRMERFTCALHRIICRGSIVVGAVDLPHVARPGWMRHPQQPGTVACPQMSLKALEYRPIRHEIHHLRLALEILQAARGSELLCQGTHERGYIAITPEVPVMVCKSVA